jgi:hypothetical protein
MAERRQVDLDFGARGHSQLAHLPVAREPGVGPTAGVEHSDRRLHPHPRSHGLSVTRACDHQAHAECTS